jgi:hypothetical protein
VCGALRSGLSSTGHSPAADLVDLGPDGDHRVAEPVELGQVLDSVGSTISVPATGNDIVGAWKP